MPNEYEVEVLEVNVIDGGIEIFARAWKEGIQLGFGKDGTIDIERFKIMNPPILVDDPLGDIVYPSYFDDSTGITIPERRLKEDPEEAIQRVLVHTISIVGKLGTEILVGSRGNTTTTLYAGSGDGSVSVSNASWATARGAASGTASTTDNRRWVMADNDSGSRTVTRLYFPVDTSSIPDADTITSATFTVTPDLTGEGTANGGLILTTTASDTSLTGTDFAALTLNSATEGTAARTALVTTGAKNFTLNATGISWINKTGYTKLGLRLDADLDDSSPAGRNYAGCYMSEATGTTNDPVLVVVHSAGASGPANLKSYNTNVLANIKSINTNLIANVKSLNTNV